MTKSFDDPNYGADLPEGHGVLFDLTMYRLQLSVRISKFRAKNIKNSLLTIFLMQHLHCTKQVKKNFAGKSTRG